MQYIKFLDWQFTDVLMMTVSCVDVDLTHLPVWTKGQMGQLLHLDIPGRCLLGLDVALSGTLALISFSLILGGRLEIRNQIC